MHKNSTPRDQLVKLFHCCLTRAVVLLFVFDVLKGCSTRVRSNCCTQELDLVSVPRSASVGTPEQVPEQETYPKQSTPIPIYKNGKVSNRLEYFSQSESGDDSSSIAQEEIVSFVDHSLVSGVGTTASNHAFSTGDSTIGTDIATFFARPVRIGNYTWLESDTVGTTRAYATWNDWVSNAYIKNKLNNYAFIRGDLKIRLQMTASPFYYGKMLVNWQALPNFTPNTIVNDTGTRYFIPQSQRPHIVLEPGKSDAYEMTLPFIYPANWLNAQSAQAFSDMGTLRHIVYSQLQSANGVTGVGINVVTYAWMENIQLSGASIGYAAQSDEYGEGPVSKPASWVAKAASYFENIPVIGSFATATRIGAGAVSAIASLFGFTNVPVIEDTAPMRSEVFPKLASSEIGFPVEKLTLDPKNELSVDPRIVGLSGVDEMAISYVAGRESWLTKLTWTTANAVDDTLFYSRVNPLLYDNDGLTNAKLYMTPMAYISNLFNSWRGDIIFRFHVVASKYHKGKLLVAFDPLGYTAQNIGNNTGVSNVVFTNIIDIGETHEFEFRVPYQMATQFLAIRSDVSATQKGWAVNTAVPSPYPPSPVYDNGLVIMRVLSTLTSPEASSSIDVHVYVRAAENIEFANPTIVDRTNKFSLYAPQSEEFTEDVVDDKMKLSKTVGGSENQYLVHFGENIKSLRTLVRRYNLVTMEQMQTSGLANYLSYSFKNFYKMPFTPGFCNIGYSFANKIVGTGLTPYNYANFIPLTYLAPAYLCYRGSVNWTFNLDCGSQCANLRVLKDNISGTAAAIGFDSQLCATPSQVAWYGMRRTGAAGQALTNQKTQSGINVQCPNMSIFKFQSTHTYYANQGTFLDGSITDFFSLEANWNYNAGSGGVLYSYAAAGTDFGLHYFMNVPTFWIYSANPTPAAS